MPKSLKITISQLNADVVGLVLKMSH
jgi:hypothetical protein